ncbi:MAG: peptidoglycan-binding protein [Phycisphaerales bacterium]
MPWYTVVQGDWLSKIAARFGLPSWKTIYYAPENGPFRSKRPDPNLIFPGDEVWIPEPKIEPDPGDTEKKHRFKLKPRPPEMLRILVRRETGEPYADRKFKIMVWDQNTQVLLEKEGQVPGDGIMEQQIPVEAAAGRYMLWPNQDATGTPLAWRLKIGHLDPVETVSGVQARLDNTGFHAGEVTGELNDQTTHAIAAFQRFCKDHAGQAHVADAGEPDGQLTDQVRKALVKFYGA